LGTGIGNRHQRGIARSKNHRPNEPAGWIRLQNRADPFDEGWRCLVFFRGELEREHMGPRRQTVTAAVQWLTIKKGLLDPVTAVDGSVHHSATRWGHPLKNDATAASGHLAVRVRFEGQLGALREPRERVELEDFVFVHALFSMTETLTILLALRSPFALSILSMTSLDAFDTVTLAATLAERLDYAFAELTKKQGFKDEKEWLEQAMARVARARDGLGDIATRAVKLPELSHVREEQAFTLQGLAIDAVEKLQAGITFHVGARAPLIEGLFGKLKLPVLRRADREDFERFYTDFEKRLTSSYAKRMFADPAYAFAAPVLDDVRQAFQSWRGSLSEEVLPETDAANVREELAAVARRLDLPMKQARLLAEAALAPLRDVFESLGIGVKPKKRRALELEEEEPPADEEHVADEGEVA
jgi:hypothetical protein